MRAARARLDAGAPGWRVEIRDDDVNTMFVVTYLLHRLCGISVADAARVMTRSHAHGRAEVGRFDSRAEAERLVARLQTHGLHGMVRGAG